MNKILILIFAIAFLSGCGKEDVSFDISTKSITLVHEEFSGILKSSETIWIENYHKGIKAFSNDTNIAVIGEKFNIKARLIGETYITFTDGKVSKDLKVTVIPQKKYSVEPVLDFGINKQELISKISNLSSYYESEGVIKQNF